MLHNALVSDELFGADAEQPRHAAGVLPLFHSFGQTVVMNVGFALRRHRRAAAALRGRPGARR